MQAAVESVPLNRYLVLASGVGIEGRSFLSEVAQQSVVAVAQRHLHEDLSRAESSLTLDALLELAGDAKSLLIVLRAVEDPALIARSNGGLQVVRGRNAAPGAHELLVSPAVSQWLTRQSRAATGEVMIARQPWRIVGEATYLGRSRALEAYTNQETLRQTFRLGNVVSSAVLTIERLDRDRLGRLEQILGDLGSEIVSLRHYFERNAAALRSGLVAAWVPSLIFVSLCASVGAYVLMQLTRRDRSAWLTLCSALGFRAGHLRAAALIEGFLLGVLAASAALALVAAAVAGRVVDAALPGGGLGLQLQLSPGVLGWIFVAGAIAGLVAVTRSGR